MLPERLRDAASLFPQPREQQRVAAPTRAEQRRRSPPSTSDSFASRLSTESDEVLGLTTLLMYGASANIVGADVVVDGGAIRNPLSAHAPF